MFSIIYSSRTARRILISVLTRQNQQCNDRHVAKCFDLGGWTCSVSKEAPPWLGPTVLGNFSILQPLDCLFEHWKSRFFILSFSENDHYSMFFNLFLPEFGANLTGKGLENFIIMYIIQWWFLCFITYCYYERIEV